MARVLPLCVAVLVSLQEVDGHSNREAGKGEAADRMMCIYYNKEYINCTWKRNMEAARGVNDKFYYWFSDTTLHKKSCSLIIENESANINCELENRMKANKWLCLYVKTSNHFTVLALNCFQLQDRGPHRLINQTGTSDLDCTYSDDRSLNCKWEQGKDAVRNTIYEVYYSFSKTALHVKECSRYLQNLSLNIGCHLHLNATGEVVAKLNWFYAYAIDSNHFTTVKPHRFLLQDQVKMNPPQNLSAKFIGKEEVLVIWDLPKNQRPEWLQYEMEYKSNMDTDWQVKEFEEQSFILPSVDPAKCYFFHLRSKINKKHAKTSFWSEWAPTLIWKEKTAVDSCPSGGINALFLVLLPIAVMAFVVLVCTLYKIKRVKTLLFPGIPDPKHLFIDLFEDHNGNFQEWLGVSKDLNMDLQSNCCAIECRIEEVPVRLKREPEDPQQPLADMTGATESVLESINKENEKSTEDVPNSQFLVHKTATIDMSTVIMNENMYITL